MKKGRNNIFIIAAPSGSGKTTLIELLLAQIPSLLFSVSHTTRPPREGEKNGSEYYFVDKATFEQMMQQGRFLEWAVVHGHYYGTCRDNLDRAEQEGRDLILDIDVQGATQVRKQLPDAISIFILPPSFSALKERLMRRQTDSMEVVQNRMASATEEIKAFDQFDYIIINSDIKPAFESLSSIIRSMRCKREFLQEKIEEILKSFTD